MNLFVKTRDALLGAALGIAVLTTGAVAQPSINLDVDTARVVKLSGEPSAVVLSNPLFADATIQASRLVLIGKNTGRTQVIVLDLNGDQLANFQVNVQRGENQVVSMYKGGVRRTYHCEPFCDQVLTVNDDAGRFKTQVEQITNKSALSAGTQQGGAAQ